MASIARKTTIVAGLTVEALAAACILAAVPGWLSLALSVIAALVWCRWLECHPAGDHPLNDPLTAPQPLFTAIRVRASGSE